MALSGRPWARTYMPGDKAKGSQIQRSVAFAPMRWALK